MGKKICKLWLPAEFSLCPPLKRRFILSRCAQRAVVAASNARHGADLSPLSIQRIARQVSLKHF
jgi:hypothetical protein